ALDGIAEYDDQLRLCRERTAQFFESFELLAMRAANGTRRVLVFADVHRGNRINLRAPQTVAAPNLKGKEGMFECQIAADDEERFALRQILRGGELAGRTAQRVNQSYDVARAVVIDIVRVQPGAREFLEKEIFFVRRMVRADHAELAG